MAQWPHSAAVRGILVLLVGMLGAQASPALTITPVTLISCPGPEGVTPCDLVTMLVDSTNMSVVPGATYARIKVNGSYVNSEKRALALFDHGITLANGAAVAGSQLPVANREPGQPVPVYAGGIGFQSGIVLSTGWVSDALGGPPSSSGRGIGMQGPNNGAFNNDESDNEGEIVTVIHGGHPAGDFQDDDFDVAITPPSGGAGEASGLEFQVKVGYDGETPRYPGFFRIELVHARNRPLT